MTAQDTQKRLAAQAAVAMIQDGMLVGLGTGSTAEIAIQLLGERVAGGLKIRGVPTSERSHRLAESLAIPLTSFDEVDSLDIDIDGADEINGDLQVIKGGGGALLREKIVASASTQVVIMVDASKVVKQLGAFKLPVEIIPFGKNVIERKLRELQGVPHLRLDKQGKPFVTDQGNWIFDCDFGLIAQPEKLARELNAIAGVVEHGLFINMATTAIVGGSDGVQIMQPRNRALNARD